MKHCLISENISYLQQAAELLRVIDDRLYTNDSNPYFDSGVGKQMRHMLDHYLRLLDGWSGRVDYDARERDPLLESDRRYTLETIDALIGDLRKLAGQDPDFDREMLIKSNEIAGNGEEIWSKTSLRRELQFLISHTVHHYALIAVILRVQEFSPPESFGVAPATLRYRQSQAEKRLHR